MQTRYIKIEAERFVREHGDKAHHKIQETLTAASRKRDLRKARFLERVANEIRRRVSPRRSWPKTEGGAGSFPDRPE